MQYDQTLPHFHWILGMGTIPGGEVTSASFLFPEPGSRGIEGSSLENPQEAPPQNPAEMRSQQAAGAKDQPGPPGAPQLPGEARSCSQSFHGCSKIPSWAPEPALGAPKGRNEAAQGHQQLLGQEKPPKNALFVLSHSAAPSEPPGWG